MQKIELEVDEILLGVSHSTYQLILKEVLGGRRIPVVIGVPEAQSIALSIEGKRLKRPNTHDLFIRFALGFEIDVVEVVINKLDEGVFFSQVFLKNNEGKNLVLDSRTSDAVAIAIRSGAPIYTYETILEQAGYYEDEVGSSPEPGRGDKDEDMPSQKHKDKQDWENLSIQELEMILQTAINEEDYGKAALIRDVIAKKKN